MLTLAHHLKCETPNDLRLSGRRPPPFGRDTPVARRSAPTAW